MPLNDERGRVQHLLRRAGFGYSAEELEEYLALGLEGAVERLLAPEVVDDSAVDRALEDLPGDPNEQPQVLIYEWHQRLLLSRRPLLEKLTYFWHDHFATAIHKVNRAALMRLQNQTLRSHALGDFRTLLLEVTRDPAMLIWLDGRTSIARAPNENYARELLELHTLGEGVEYTEADIKEAARALTGWVVSNGRRDDLPIGAHFFPPRHDGGAKTFLGVSGALDDEDVVEVLADRPETAELIGRKLWQFFAVPEPSSELLQATTDAYFAHDRSIAAVVRTILLSEAMYSDAAYRWRIKTPVELVTGALRALEAPSVSGSIRATIGMGQLLYDPPNPAGWAGGFAWINSTTLLERANFMNALTGAGLQRGLDVDVGGLVARHGVGGSAGEVADFLLDLFVGGDAGEGTRDALVDHLGGPVHYDFREAAQSGRINGAAYLALTMPLYQLA